MWGIIGKVLARRGLTKGSLAALPHGERTNLVDGIVAEADALHERNRDYSGALVRQLAGNAGVVKLSAQPDGTGSFYGSYDDGAGNVSRLDVMPPRALWTGDFSDSAADAADWVVYLDGEEVTRAATIAALPVLGTGILKN